MDTLKTVLLIANIVIICYFLAVNSFYIILNFLSYFALKRYKFERSITDYERPFQSTFYKPVSIIIPAHNEEQTIVDTVRSVVSLKYPEFEVIVVNDGSTDDTLNSLIKAFEMVPSNSPFNYEIECSRINTIYESKTHTGLKLADKVQGGKADALNAGINISTFPLFCNIDADSLIDSKSLLQIVKPFVEDHRVQAAGGVIRIANDCEIKNGTILHINLPRKSLVKFQVIEYLRAFLFGRVGWSSIQSLMIISGAFAVFRKRSVVMCGGYSVNTVGEDMELVLKLHRVMKRLKKDYRFVFLADPVCWTQAPENYKSLSMQRRRWQQGLAESLMSNRAIFLNPRYGTLGMIGYPFFLFFEMASPLIEFPGYIIFLISAILGIINVQYMLAFLITAVLLGILLSVSSLLLEEITFRKYESLNDVLVLFLFAILENFGYRQLHSWWRFRGLLDFLFGKSEWKRVDRVNFSQSVQ